MASDELEASDLKLIPLVFAGWLRYLMAVDDNGNAFEPSSDPMLAELTPYLKDINGMMSRQRKDTSNSCKE